MLNARMAKYCEEKGLLGEEQGGFRVDRGCPDQLFILTEVLAGRRQLGRRTYACFIDVRKAYDRVCHGGMGCSKHCGRRACADGLGGSSAATTRT